MKSDGLTSNQRYVIRHPERIRESNRKYRESHREQMKVYLKKWRETHVVHLNNYRAKYRQERIEYDRKYYREHKKQQYENQRLWRIKNPKKQRVYNKISTHPELYPLSDKCVFCDETNKLERGHLDYEDDGFNYVTVCHPCNHWMEKR